MSYIAFIENNWPADTYRVWLGLRSNDERRVLTRDGLLKPIDPNAVLDPADALFEIPRGAAPVLLVELARVLGAVEHPEQLRRDFEHERGRVDRLIEHLREVAMAGIRHGV